MDRIQGGVNGKKLDDVDVGRYDRSISFLFLFVFFVSAGSGACLGAAVHWPWWCWLTDARIVVSGVRWRPLLWGVSVSVSVALQ